MFDVIAVHDGFDVSGCETNIDCRLLTALLLCDVAGAGDEVDDWLPVRMRHLLNALTAAPQVADTAAKRLELSATNGRCDVIALDTRHTRMFVMLLENENVGNDCISKMTTYSVILKLVTPQTFCAMSVL